ncbi:MAG: hypothetical protein AB1640_16310 [bacterium]
MNGDTKREIRLVEWMVVAAVAGILSSIAMPNYLGIQRRLRAESLVSRAGAASGELLQWIDASLREARFAVDTDGDGDLRDEERPLDNARVLQAFTKLYNEKFANVSPLTREPLFAVELPETRPDRCTRDGRIHLIPLSAADGRTLGAQLVVTNSAFEGGPRDDGVLASFRAYAGEP